MVPAIGYSFYVFSKAQYTNYGHDYRVPVTCNLLRCFCQQYLQQKQTIRIQWQSCCISGGRGFYFFFASSIYRNEVLGRDIFPATSYLIEVLGGDVEIFSYKCLGDKQCSSMCSVQSIIKINVHFFKAVLYAIAPSFPRSYPRSIPAVTFQCGSLR